MGCGVFAEYRQARRSCVIIEMHFRKVVLTQGSVGVRQQAIEHFHLIVTPAPSGSSRYTIFCRRRVPHATLSLPTSCVIEPSLRDASLVPMLPCGHTFHFTNSLSPCDACGFSPTTTAFADCIFADAEWGAHATTVCFASFITQAQRSYRYHQDGTHANAALWAPWTTARSPIGVPNQLRASVR